MALMRMSNDMQVEFNCNYFVALLVLVTWRSGVWVSLSAVVTYFNRGFYDGVVVGMFSLLALRGIVKAVQELNAA